MNAKFSSNNSPITLYRNALSGHCHRVELFMSLLELPYETIELDMANGAHKAPDYLALNLFGQVPVIDDNGTIISDSNAILIYLNQRYNNGYEWMPSSPEKAAEVQRWFSVSAGAIASGPAAARLVHVFGATLDYDMAKQKAIELFDTLNPWLQKYDFLAGDQITLADISAYSYIAHAPEGGVSLDAYPEIQEWLARIEALSLFVPMKSSAIPAV